ncbi:MAG: CBS domain-containing protein [Anaerolineae bacterium]|nr:CBS domain-containing protein [Anaerolineae bacterium]
MKTCADVMTKDPAFCLAGDTVDKAATLMKQEDVGAVPVIDSPQSKRLMGIVTDRDLALNIVAEGRDARNVRIEEVMTRNPITCREGDEVDKAMNAMADHQVRRIPVVDQQNRMIGIISQADLATRIDKPKKTAEVLEEISQPDDTK